MSRLSLLEADWPAADRALLADLLRRGGLFDEVGPLAHIKPISRRNLVTAYGRWLGWLTQVEPAALLEPPVARASSERYRTWLASVGSLAPRSQHTLGDLTLWLLRAATPEADWSAHARVLSLIWHAAAKHRSPRKDGRIVSTAVLLHAALQRSRNLEQGATPHDLRTAVARRDAAMVAFLAVLPIRRRAFCELALGRSVLVCGSGLQVVLDSAMTKTGQHWEARVPDVLRDIMTDYINHVRPVLASRASCPSPALWLNDHGRPYGGNYLGAHFTKVTTALIGVPIPPHMMRDCAATTLAYDSPDSARLTRGLLGHTTFRTGEQHYNQAQGIEAGRRYADVIARLGDTRS